MSSVVLWTCPTTGVTASWNKEGPKWTCFVPTHQSTEPGFEGAWEGVTTSYATQELAIEAAKRKAEALMAKADSEDRSGNSRPH
jgi:hypothetical protein